MGSRRKRAVPAGITNDLKAPRRESLLPATIFPRRNISRESDCTLIVKRCASEIIMSKVKDDCSLVPSGFHPHEFLIKVLEKRGVKVSACPYDRIDEFFISPAPEEIEAHKSSMLFAPLIFAPSVTWNAGGDQ